jgi:uncharacterized membrane protein (UPF0127 family)
VPGGPAGIDLRDARGFRARLLGLAGLPSPAGDVGLLLAGTRSAHTAGMRFRLDLVWLDRAGGVLRVDEAVAPWRLRWCRRAAALLELPAGGARRAALRPGARALAESVSSCPRRGPRRGAACP